MNGTSFPDDRPRLFALDALAFRLGVDTHQARAWLKTSGRGYLIRRGDRWFAILRPERKEPDA